MSLDESDEKALNLDLNKIDGDRDAEKLEDLLRDININNKDLIEYKGFDEDEINKIFGSLDELDDNTFKWEECQN